MAIIVVEETPRLASLQGEEREDFFKSVEYYGSNQLESRQGEIHVELVRIFSNPESFIEHALRNIYGLNYGHDAFMGGAISVHEPTLRLDYEFGNGVYVVEDMYTRPFYVLREVV